MPIPKSIRTLQSMVKGRKWLFAKYTLQEQLAAIKLLGRTQSHDALEFLNNLYYATISTDAEANVVLMSGASGASASIESRTEKHRYHAASGPLRNALDFDVDLGNTYSGWRTDAEIAADRQQYLSREPHQIVQTAIADLHASVSES